MINTKEIFKKMELENIKQEYLADKLKISQSTLSLKLNNKRALSIEEMFIVADILVIKPEEFRIFFNLSVA